MAKREGYESVYWKGQVAAFGDLPDTGQQTTTIRFVVNEGIYYKWDGEEWEPHKTYHYDYGAMLIRADTLEEAIITYLNDSAWVVNGTEGGFLVSEVLDEVKRRLG